MKIFYSLFCCVVALRYGVGSVIDRSRVQFSTGPLLAKIGQLSLASLPGCKME